MTIRKTLTELERPLDKWEILERIKRIQGFNEVRDQALGAFLYLTGCRIEEVLPYRKERNLNRTLKNKKTGERVAAPIMKLTETGQPIIKKQVEIYKDHIKINTVRCLKRRKSIYRNVVIPINEREKEFINILLKYIATLSDDSALFPIKRARAYQIFSKVGLYNHYFRHIRSTVLVTDYNLSPNDLQHFYGWKSSASGDAYIHLATKDLLKKMGVGD